MGWLLSWWLWSDDPAAVCQSEGSTHHLQDQLHLLLTDEKNTNNSFIYNFCKLNQQTERDDSVATGLCTWWTLAALYDSVPSTWSAGLAEGCSVFETSEPPAPAVLALQGLNSALSFMRSYSLILARALSKWITVLPIRAAKKGEQGSEKKETEMGPKKFKIDEARERRL